MSKICNKCKYKIGNICGLSVSVVKKVLHYNHHPDLVNKDEFDCKEFMKEYCPYYLEKIMEK